MSIVRSYGPLIWLVRVMQLVESGLTGVRHVSATRAISRVQLANYLLSVFGYDADYRRESRHERSVPHLGRVELATVYDDELSQPLLSVIDCPRFHRRDQLPFTAGPPGGI
jgi:hypothetical protein